jgi:DNA helicase-2/ATP-dependent DNA helicase PcrA
MDIINSLNKQQAEAVLCNDGALLVLAGAGTGKTRVLTSKIINILQSGLAFPSEILAVTFTNKAAKEMRNRVANCISGDLSSLWIGTFHAMSARILRQHSELVGLRSDFTIIDSDDSTRLIKQILKEMDVDQKEFPAKNYAWLISSWKDKGLAPEDVGGLKFKSEKTPDAKNIYAIYQNRLRNLNSVDFGDLLLYVLKIFAKDDYIANAYANKFKYLLVDEYQDTNFAQYLWLKRMAGHGRKEKINICCVGDDDQSIYGWRGAEIGNILRFEGDYKGAKIVKLEQNYRSTQYILNVASNIIDNNCGRHKKRLRTDGDNGEKVNLGSFSNDREESGFIASEIKRLHLDAGLKFNDMAILVRAGYQTRNFEETFLRKEIPYRVIGGLRFYERREVKDAIAYLRVVANPNDNLAFARIVNVPKRGIGNTTLSVIMQNGNEKSISFIDSTLELCEIGRFSGKTKDSLMGLVENFAKWRGLAKEVECSVLAETILEESGYIKYYKAEETLESQGRLENLKEFVRSLESFDNLVEFLEYVSLISENANEEKADKDAVNIMTIHSAKGLEFDTVFLPGWEEGIFPSPKSLENKSGLEEERRLAYVAITRAKKRVYISYAQSRYEFGKVNEMLPSRFVAELSQDDISEIETNDVDDAVKRYVRKLSSSDEYLSEHKTKKLVNLGSKKFGGFVNKKSMEFFKKASVKMESGGFRIGGKVEHKKFGIGTVLEIKENKLTISFENYGIKNILSSFVDKK